MNTYNRPQQNNVGMLPERKNFYQKPAAIYNYIPLQQYNISLHVTKQLKAAQIFLKFNKWLKLTCEKQKYANY